MFALKIDISPKSRLCADTDRNRLGSVSQIRKNSLRGSRTPSPGIRLAALAINENTCVLFSTRQNCLYDSSFNHNTCSKWTLLHSPTSSILIMATFLIMATLLVFFGVVKPTSSLYTSSSCLISNSQCSEILLNTTIGSKFLGNAF
ncbi:hypothetical protein Pla110_13610 [Polystyrenella longa]|uniref:Uncharacterized protein n=1 Tax=Polystyrenella longa TaxID=2528007 RepID=A0A518CKA0_9PLAN|nr:hypothetical protein Pla110_13610 [Polystyrenella longa]